MKFSTILLILSLNLLALSSPARNSEINFSEKTNEIENLDEETTEYFNEEVSEIITNDNICNTQECLDISNKIIDSIDSSVDPCDDFFEFTCGNYMKTHVPDEDTRYYDWFSDAGDIIKENLIKILEGNYLPSKNLTIEAQEYDEKMFYKMKDFYDSCMDTDKINEKGVQPIFDLIKELKINEIKDKHFDVRELTEILVELHKRKVNVNPFFEIDFVVDDDMSLYIQLIRTSRITEDYEKTESEIREGIKAILIKIYKDSEDRDFDKMVDSIMKLDEKLFKEVENEEENITDTNENDENQDNSENNTDESEEDSENNENQDNSEKNTDENKNNENQSNYSAKKFVRSLNLNSKFSGIHWELNINKKATDENTEKEYENSKFFSIDPIPLKSLNEKYPSIDWLLYLTERFEDIGMKGFITEDTKVDLDDKAFFENLNKVLSEVDSETLTYYFEWNVIINFINFLPREYRRAYHQIADENEKNTTPRSELCYELVNDAMDMAAGKYFVERNFTPAKKYYAEKVIEYIKQSMINRIPEMEWLDDETIEYAYKKVASMTEMIGYEDYILDPKYIYEKYKTIEIKRDDFFSNALSHSIYKNRNYITGADNLSELIDSEIAPQVNKKDIILFIKISRII
ncbi:hypothetical protein PIROE2DRAFT_6618 [Piromyces sp. E2]|nr:hypothetical protein PIROE2DRAFT_6618 [Piromyces sp. E2]|eukprot:OUM66188.1 hypothetical protein PIROE2DRAFT_6618 [Piromyces sp. E2]